MNTVLCERNTTFMMLCDLFKVNKFICLKFLQLCTNLKRCAHIILNLYGYLRTYLGIYSRKENLICRLD